MRKIDGKMPALIVLRVQSEETMNWLDAAIWHNDELQKIRDDLLGVLSDGDGVGRTSVGGDRPGSAAWPRTWIPRGKDAEVVCGTTH